MPIHRATRIVITLTLIVLAILIIFISSANGSSQPEGHLTVTKLLREATTTTTVPTTTTTKPPPRIKLVRRSNPLDGRTWDATELRLAIHGCESGSYTVSNASGHRGGYQYADTTWNGYMGYSRADLAPPAVQDQRASEDIARGAGQIWSDWAASFPCWGRVIH